MRDRTVRSVLVYILLTACVIDSDVSPNHRRHTRHRHDHDRNGDDRSRADNHPVRLTNDLVLKKLMPRLDKSCSARSSASSSRVGEMRVHAPDVAHAQVLRYLRRKTPKEFIVAVYKCDAGYALTGPSDRLYCSRGGWIGRKPVCEKVHGLDPDTVLELERLFPTIGLHSTEKNLPTTMQADNGGTTSSLPDRERYEEDQSLCAGVRSGCDQECVVVHGRPTCVCYPGFVKNGSSCIDIDECATNNGGCESLCNNTLGSFFCSCDEGFRLGTDGKSCTDINECLLRNGHGPCEDTCTNTPGSYRCSCRGPGASLADDRKTCARAEDVACERAKCSHTCVYARARGEAFCTCPSGMRLGRDYHTCEDINECEIEEVSSTCEYGCVNTPGSFHCATFGDIQNGTNSESNDIDTIHTEDTKDPEDSDDDDEESENDGDEEEPEPEQIGGTEASYNASTVHGDRRGEGYGRDDFLFNGGGEGGQDRGEDGYVYNRPTSPGVFEESTTGEDQIFSNTDEEKRVTAIPDGDGEESVTTVRSVEVSTRSGDRDGREEKRLDPDEESEGVETSTSRYEEDDGVNGEETHRIEARKKISGNDEDNNLNEEENENDEDEDDDYDDEEDDDDDEDENVEDDDDEDVEDENGNGVGDHKKETNCTEGYKDTPEGCVDIDECEEIDVSCSHDCVNTPGSYVCSCPSGYAMHPDDSKSCEDVNECLDKPCSHVCVNEVSTFHCECPAGYDLDADNRTCIEGPVLCSAEYMRRHGLTVCGCPETYLNSSSGCIPKKNCSHDYSIEDTTVVCKCPRGYSLEEDLSTCSDVNECDEDPCRHVCVNTEGSYRCECLEGYTASAEDPGNCTDVDECVNDPCTHGCVNTPGSFRCECPDNFVLESDNTTCTELLICSPRYRAKHRLDTCTCPDGFVETPHGCVAKKNCTHGYKIDGVDITCTCPRGFVVEENGCVDVDECAESNGGCSHGCVNLEGSYECVCPERMRISASNSSVCEQVDPCGIDNGGCDHVCNNDGGVVRCSCLEGFEIDGVLCKESSAGPCARLNCSHVCQESNGTATCQCPGTMISNGTRCFEDLCVVDNGGCSHICSTVDGEVVCACPDDGGGYVLDGRECVSKDPCAIDNGGCSHFCRTVRGKPKCFCPLDQDWILTDGKTCVGDRDPCSNNGGCSHACTVRNGKAACSCPDGSRTILRGGKTCVPVDPCAVDNGGCSDACEDVDGEAVCSCGDDPDLVLNGTTCVFVDPCKDNNGGCSHVCAHADGKIVCGCPSGYELIRKTCVEVDPCERDNGGCSHVCDIDDNDAIVCACPPGMYLRDRKTCTSVDPCTIDNGNCTGTCTIVDSRPVCVEEPAEGAAINMCRIGNGNCSHECSWNPSRGIICLCPDGYDLAADRRTCERAEICECSHGCRVEGLRVTCVCPDGYEPRGKTCYVRDPCSIDNGGCSDHCRNANGTAECYCPAGFELIANGCFREDPCAVANGGCSHVCLNADGVARCVCPDMHVLENRTECRPIDPCTYDNGNCDQRCVYRDGIVSCECFDGFKKSGNSCVCHDGYKKSGDSCVPIDPCRVDNGGCSHVCERENGTVACRCPPEYENVNGKCSKLDKCLINNGGCSHTCTHGDGDGVVVCRCPVGFELAHDRKTCARIVKCRNCSHGCVEISGTTKCQCPSGYELRDGTTCVKVDPCRIRNGGCSHYCKSIDGRVKCLCPLYHALKGKQCRPVDPCEINNGGCSHVCLRGEDGRAVCRCPPGYRLEHGTQCHYTNPCLIGNGNCEHTCTSVEGSVECRCRDGYELVDGRSCRRSDPCTVDNGGCTHGCVGVNGTSQCTCPERYTLKEDGTTCVRQDPCGSSNGNCTDICRRSADGVAECLCFKGRTLLDDRRTCTKTTDPCAIDNGNCSDVCANVDGAPACACPKGRTLGVDGRTCVVDRHHNPCRIGNGGCAHVCEMIKGIRHCFCDPGYYLSLDQRTCLRIDPCLANNGGCTDVCESGADGAAKCSCYVGRYLADDRATCVRIDTCRIANGGCEQRCVELDGGGYRCVCRRGYLLSSDSRSCLKINKEATCAVLKAPEHGYVKCLGEYRDRVPAGSQCIVWCNKGYKLNGAPLMTCNATGTWGKNPVCIPVSCPKLIAPDHGRLMPATCSTSKTFPGQKCMLSCRRGFRPIRPRVPFVCLPSLQWSVPDAEKITKGFCIKVVESPKPTIRCPNGGEIIVTLPVGENSAYVRIPRPESNMDWWRHVTAKPEWGKLPGIKLPAGVNEVVFTAWSPEADMSASCNLKIHVQDVEPPKTTFCPESMHVVLRANEYKRKIYWQEPEFVDNVAITKIYRSMEPGMLLAPGIYHVSYVASDSAGNNARCLFAVAVKPSEMINDSPKPYRSVLVCPGSIQIIAQHEHKPKPASGCYYRHVRQHRMRPQMNYGLSNGRRTWTRCCG